MVFGPLFSVSVVDGLPSKDRPQVDPERREQAKRAAAKLGLLSPTGVFP